MEVLCSEAGNRCRNQVSTSALLLESYASDFELTEVKQNIDRQDRKQKRGGAK
jgi:hypothetical protein